jgi:uncharacterized DUF497 family protein
VRWTWDTNKDRANKRKHGLSFATARLVFDDPLAISRLDPTSAEERWQTIGFIDQLVVVVVHTWPDAHSRNGEEVGRIISARKATRHERKAYEEGHF